MFSRRDKAIMAFKMLRYGMAQNRCISTGKSKDTHNVYSAISVHGKEIGRGSAGTVVFDGIFNGFRPSAVKRIPINKVDNDMIVHRLRNDNHPNIVPIYAVEYTEQYLYCAMGRCSFSLDDLIHKRDDIVGKHELQLFENNMDIKLDIMKDIVRGLEYLHLHNVTLLNLNPRRILLVQEDSTLRARISTIELANVKCENGNTREVCSEATNMFDMGCIFHHMIVGKHPFRALDCSDNTHANKRDFPSSEYDSMQEAMHIISQLLEVNMKLRPSIKEVENHPVFWDSYKTISFLWDVGGFMHSQGRNSRIWDDITNIQDKVVGNMEWWRRIPTTLYQQMRGRRYYDNSIIGLLQFIYDMIDRYWLLPRPPEKWYPTGIDSFVDERFPRLVIELYLIMRQPAHCHPVLEKYY